MFPAGEQKLAQSLFHSLDQHNDGVIGYKDFLMGMTILCLGDKQQKLEFLFHMYDTNQDGSIDIADYIAMTHNIVEFSRKFSSVALSDTKDSVSLANKQKFLDKIDQDVNTYFNTFDGDHDGKLSKQEFLEFAKSNPGMVQIEQLNEWFQHSFQPHLDVKIGLIGLKDCGKTSLIKKFLKIEFGGFGYKYNGEITIGDVPISLSIIDSDEHNRKLVYPKVDVIMLCFPCSTVGFDEVLKLRKQVTKYAPKARVLLVATQSDRTFRKFDALFLIDKLSADGCVTCSSLSDDHQTFVDVFTTAAQLVIPPMLIRPKSIHLVCCAVGPEFCGKSSFVQSMLPAGTFNFSYAYKVEIDDVKGTCVHLDMIDSDSHNRSLSYRGIDFAIVVVSLADEEDYTALMKTISKEIKSHTDGVPVVMVATKMDITTDKGKALVERYRKIISPVAYFPCVAKDPDQVKRVIHGAVSAVIPFRSLVPDDIEKKAKKVVQNVGVKNLQKVEEHPGRSPFRSRRVLAVPTTPQSSSADLDISLNAPFGVSTSSFSSDNASSSSSILPPPPPVSSKNLSSSSSSTVLPPPPKSSPAASIPPPIASQDPSLNIVRPRPVPKTYFSNNNQALNDNNQASSSNNNQTSSVDPVIDRVVAKYEWIPDLDALPPVKHGYLRLNRWDVVSVHSKNDTTGW
eukprot:CAMPEP_0201545522 /NCGR_PEP_ID=MMETSP0173_2-20130828/2014_1 /ASSEMBLY_ACC=CAM_ASM_000268 /TAXON_ID=218659 /ORGANISM="Vexillifera sp., Strain DIVA3 564/2" /LENGTH=678 /DNA_ID=CAMNT_0047953937 /DNA_START=69 /DNA_END=2102 /DNA_ORIENTATION=-